MAQPETGDAVLFVDAPLVVANETGQRLCETQVGQRYGRWRVSANITNLHSPRLAGVQFLRLAELSAWRYSDGSGGPPDCGRFVSETYPYTTLVGAAELGYDTERPRYKRKPPHLPATQWRAERAATCDTLIRRLSHLADADPPLLLQSHPITVELAEQPSPVSDGAYKHREDLIDALLRAWTASLWARHGLDRCQVLGLPATPTSGPAATIIVPTRPEQRRQPLPQSATASGRVRPGHAKYAVTYLESAWVLTATRVAAGSRMQNGVFRAASGRSRCDSAVFYGPAQMHRVTGKSAQILTCGTLGPAG